jgi:hypothetical protein
MDIKNIPEPFKTKIEQISSFDLSDEIKATVENAVSNNNTWEDARNEIFNGLQFIKDEANKAQSNFC